MLSIHILLWSPWQTAGTAVVPKGTPDVYGAYGNTATCTAQGFFFQVSGLCIVLYYAFLSVYSWAVIVYGNFDPKRYSRIEPYIHVVAHLYPIGSAIYLLYIEAYNFGGLLCFVASIPFGCGDNSGIECVRGPQNISAVIWAATGGPSLFVMLFPAIVMLALFITVYRIDRRNSSVTQSKRRLFGMKPRIVFMQSAVYLGVIYLIYIPVLADTIVLIMLNKRSFGSAVAVTMFTDSMGLWIAIVYWYFSFHGSSSEIKVIGMGNRPSLNKDNNSSSGVHKLTTEGEEDSVDGASNEDQNRKTETTYSFNIFDGTNVSDSPFAQFLFEGDEQDVADDEADTEFWKGTQQVR